MLRSDTHKRAMERLEQLIDPDWVAESDAVQQALWDGRPFDRLPCIVSTPTPPDWPTYPFTERWDDVEKQFIHLMGGNYVGALLRDDRALHLEPDYGVVTIPELFGVESEVTDEGLAMSKGLHDVEKVRALVERGVPAFDNPLSRKIEEFEDFGRAVLSQYPKLRELVHWNIPNIQGPFDLACLIWGSDILVGLYDEPELIERLMDLVTDAYIAYGTYHKQRLGLPMDSAYHCAGVRLVHGGVRICNDSSVLVGGEVYRTLSKPRDLRAFAPFHGGWVQWRLRKDLDDEGVDQQWFAEAIPEPDERRPIKVPAFWDRTDVGPYHGTAWYRTTFRMPGTWEHTTVDLTFGAVDEQAWVYLNGQLVGEHTIASEGRDIEGFSIGDLWALYVHEGQLFFQCGKGNAFRAAQQAVIRVPIQAGKHTIEWSVDATRHRAALRVDGGDVAWSNTPIYTCISGNDPGGIGRIHGGGVCRDAGGWTRGNAGAFTGAIHSATVCPDKACF